MNERRGQKTRGSRSSVEVTTPSGVSGPRADAVGTPAASAVVEAPPAEALRAAIKAKPTHYKIISISLYQDDIELLESLVAELKRRGHTKANKSQLIRFALHTVDLDGIPRGY